MNQKPIKRNQAIARLAAAFKLIGRIELISIVLMLISRIFTLGYTGFKDGLPIKIAKTEYNTPKL